MAAISTKNNTSWASEAICKLRAEGDYLNIRKDHLDSEHFPYMFTLKGMEVREMPSTSITNMAPIA